MIYLDNAATTFIKPQGVYAAVSHAMRELASPGRGGHEAAMKAAEISYRCREKAAQLFNVPEPENVVFTFNATHALNTAIRSLASGGGRVVVSGYEHNSVMRPLYDVGAKTVIARSELFDEKGTLEAFYRSITNDTELVVVNHVSNVFGFILPVYEISEMCRKKGVPLIVDASQSAGVLPVDFKRLGARFVAMPGHKGLYGPQGTGLLLCGEVPRIFMSGGTGSASLLPSMPDTLPDRAEAGTHNMPGIAGLLEGMEFVLSKGTDAILRHERALVSETVSGLSRIPGVRLYASGKGAGVLSFNISGMDPEETARKLDERGIAVRAGLHCSPEAHRSAGTLRTGTVRASVSAFTARKDTRALIRAVSEIIR